MLGSVCTRIVSEGNGFLLVEDRCAPLRPKGSSPNQLFLFRTFPALHRVLALAGRAFAGMLFSVDQFDRQARAGVFGGLAGVVLIEPSVGVGRDAGVEGAIAASEDIQEPFIHRSYLCKPTINGGPPGRWSLFDISDMSIDSGRPSDVARSERVSTMPRFEGQDHLRCSMWLIR